MSISRAVKLLCILMLLCGSVFGQTTSSNLLGTLIDPAQAVIPGAEVQLTEQATGAARTTATTAEGIFRFNNLPPGNRSVSVKAQGFKSYLQKDIALTVSETRDLGRVALELGTLQEEVTVTAQATPVQVASSEKSATIEGAQLNQIAIKGRNLFDYLTVLPGITGRGSSETSKGGGVTINGGGDFNFTVDGITEFDTGSNGCCHYVPNLDAIGEIKCCPPITRPNMAATRAEPSPLSPRAAAGISPAPPGGISVTRSLMPTVGKTTGPTRQKPNIATICMDTASEARSIFPRCSTRKRSICFSSLPRSGPSNCRLQLSLLQTYPPNWSAKAIFPKAVIKLAIWLLLWIPQPANPFPVT
jgi:hypothetical protein